MLRSSPTPSSRYPGVAEGGLGCCRLTRSRSITCSRSSRWIPELSSLSFSPIISSAVSSPSGLSVVVGHDRDAADGDGDGCPFERASMSRVPCPSL